MHFAKGASGSEMIPNVTFWKAVPGLVKASTHIHTHTHTHMYQSKVHFALAKKLITKC